MPTPPSSKDFRFPDWLDFKNEDQVAWLRRYFGKKEFASDPALNGPMEFFLDKLPDSRASYELLLKAKSAWRQKQQRQQRKGIKAYSFLLPVEVHTTLKRIANIRRISMTEAVECAINETLQTSKKHSEELNTLISSHKREIAKKNQELKSLRKKARFNSYARAKKITILEEALETALIQIEEAGLELPAATDAEPAETYSEETKEKVKKKMKEIKAKAGISRLAYTGSPLEK